jgi:hypothetical protein
LKPEKDPNCTGSGFGFSKLLILDDKHSRWQPQPVTQPGMLGETMQARLLSNQQVPELSM